MNHRAFLGLGATSIGVGALYGTNAFSSSNAGRSVSVTAAEDQANALLGIDGIDDSPVEFINNAGVAMSVELTSDDVEFDPSSFAIDSDTDQRQEVDFQGEGTATVEAFLGDGGSAGTITLERSFENPFDSGDEKNYRDGESGDAAQPEDPSGTIENPGNVNERDGNSSTAISPGGQRTKVGFRLPVQSASSDYVFELVIGESTNRGALNNYEVYLVNENGNPENGLDPRLDDLDVGENEVEYDEAQVKDIQLYLIFEQTSSGDQGVDIDYFELRPA